MSEPSVVFEAVTRHFGKKIALQDLNLRLEAGRILGLVGRNGAGKTTALRLAHGILYPDAGHARVLGLDPVTEGPSLRERVSLLCEESALYPWMTVREILDFAGAVHPRWDVAMADSLTERLQLDPAPRIKTLSRGNRAKVALTIAVASRPELLLLDDPTAGLDPLVRREVLQGVLEAVSAEGGAVIYASHLVGDVERVADDIVFLDEGHVGFEGSLEDLKQRIWSARAVFDDDAPTHFDLAGKIDWTADGRVLRVVAESSHAELEHAICDMGAKDVVIESIGLEEILVAYLRRGGEHEVKHV